MASARPLRYDLSGVRKKEETEELLVFGYSCKLFRDDEKALYIDQGKHLIPWMGDDTLKIDRYDVRGTVYDLRPLEPLGGGASDALWSTLSDAERKVEQLCDEERYRALYHNDAEEAMYQEEELKRLHKALDPQNSYGQVAYSYDNETEPTSAGASESKEPDDAGEEEDEPFIPPIELDIPVGMVLPERTKLNAIIEKTAAFISTQGPQMEIILKMKQSNNPQFSFLSFDCPLHAYYRHLLMAIKTGRYKTKEQRKEQEQSDSENSEHYLHPSLATATKPVELAPSIPSISYKPSADCAYSLLVSKIKDRHSKLADDNSAPGSPADSSGRLDNSSGTAQSIIAPPPDIQVIIDKMASYVLKNGRDFESVVRSKGDERFAFLDTGHKFHPYYEHKVRVYQGLEPPINFNEAAVASNCKKPAPDSVTKKQSPEKKPRPILLPGYEYSDDSSESDEDESDCSKTSLKGKPKLAPVSFSIKKPKEAEILKEVKSALPVEEESSEEEIDGDGDASSKQSNIAVDSKPADAEPVEGSSTLPDPEEEMKRLQQLLREKEKQLREQGKLKKISERRSQDIFQTDTSEAELLPPLPAVPPPPVQDTVQIEPVVAENIIEESIKCEENKASEEDKIASDGKKEVADVPVISLNADDILNEISETEVIDLTEEVDDAPKVSDTTRLERKRKAAAFLSRLQKNRHLNKNGGSRPASDSDAASRHSTPSPTRLKREKTDISIVNFHEASIPKTSLMARLAASTHMPRQPSSEKTKMSKEKSRIHRKSESPVKPSKEREDKTFNRHKHKRRKESYSSSESENERSRSRSRSVSYSRSPSHKRRQGEDSDSEQRINRYHKGAKGGHRKKNDSIELVEAAREQSRHHRRHEDERRSHNFSHNFSQSRGGTRGQSRVHGRVSSQDYTHSNVVHSKRNESQVSDSDSSN